MSGIFTVAGLNSFSVLCQRPTAEWCPPLTYFQFSSFSPARRALFTTVADNASCGMRAPTSVCVRIKAWTACGLGGRSSWRRRQKKKRRWNPIPGAAHFHSPKFVFNKHSPIGKRRPLFGGQTQYTTRRTRLSQYLAAACGVVTEFPFREGGARSPGDPGCLFQAIVRHLINAAR